MRAFLGACMFVVTVVLTWLLMGVVLHAQNYGPPYPQGSFYQKGTIISEQGFGLVGCPTGQFIFGDGSGCGPGPGPGPFLPLSGGTLNGPLTAPFINTIANVSSYSGATADVQINACLAANTICDGRSYGATIQTIATTVEIGVSGNYKVLLLDKATQFKPSSGSIPSVMFKINRNGVLNGVHVVIPASTSYTGKVLDVEDTIGTTGENQFSISNTLIEATADTGNTAYCLYISPPSGSYFQLQTIHDIGCNGIKFGLYLKPIGTSGYLNGNNFNNFVINGIVGGGSDAVTLDGSSGTLGIIGNTFTNFQIENAQIHYLGSNQINQNWFVGAHIWDATTPVTDSNTQAQGNGFIGHMDFAPNDVTNSYYLENSNTLSGSTSGDVINAIYNASSNHQYSWRLSGTSGVGPSGTLCLRDENAPGCRLMLDTSGNWGFGATLASAISAPIHWSPAGLMTFGSITYNGGATGSTVVLPNDTWLYSENSSHGTNCGLIQLTGSSLTSIDSCGNGTNFGGGVNIPSGKAATVGGGTIGITSSGAICTMSTGTSCTTTIPSGSAHCSATIQGSTAIASACSVSGTTATVTAATSNSSAWLVISTQ